VVSTQKRSQNSNVRFAGMTFSSMKGFPAKDMPVSPDPKDPHGTVGLELLLGKTFVMDFPKQRVCLLERGDLPESLDQAADWASAEIRHGKLYVDLELNGKKLDGFITTQVQVFIRLTLI